MPSASQSFMHNCAD